jgi:hypothetical protein
MQKVEGSNPFSRFRIRIYRALNGVSLGDLRGATAALAASVLLGRPRLEFEADEALVADDPGVMTWLDHIGVAGTHLGLGAVVMLDDQLAGLDDADVPNLAAVGTGDRLHALGPPPPRLERHAGSRCFTQAHHVHPRLIRGASLVR